MDKALSESKGPIGSFNVCQRGQISHDRTTEIRSISAYYHKQLKETIANQYFDKDLSVLRNEISSRGLNTEAALVFICTENVP